MGVPQSQIYICNGVRLDNRYEHTLYFSDIDEQNAYFEGRVVKTLPLYSYLRKSWDIKVEATLEEAESWTYLYFKNTVNPTGKRYYCFINSVEYINDFTTILHIELDVMQTYMFDYQLTPCFVEREHAVDDTIGANTMDESLELGELIDCATKDLVVSDNELCILILATINPNEASTTTAAPAVPMLYNNVFSGLKIWAVPASKWASWASQLEALTEAGFIDGIINMWMYPQELVLLAGESTWEDDDIAKPVASCSESGYNFLVTNDYTPFGGYVPKNNKLYCYPFNFLYMSNNAGQSTNFRYERFTYPDKMTFRVYGTLSPEAAMKIVPRNYNGVTENYEMGMSLGNYPTCAWDSDVYKLWLAQNYNQIQVQGVTNVIQAGAGVATALGGLFTGNVGGALGGVAMAANAATNIAQQVAQHKDMQVQPPQARGSFSSGVNMTAGKHCFTIYNKSVDYEHARMIDNYFQMYGYKVQRVKQPNIHARERFTYVKTVGCVVDGNIARDYAAQIESIYDRGITFWAAPYDIGYYAVNPTL